MDQLLGGLPAYMIFAAIIVKWVIDSKKNGNGGDVCAKLDELRVAMADVAKALQPLAALDDDGKLRIYDGSKRVAALVDESRQQILDDLKETRHAIRNDVQKVMGA